MEGPTPQLDTPLRWLGVSKPGYLRAPKNRHRIGASGHCTKLLTQPLNPTTGVVNHPTIACSGGLNPAAVGQQPEFEPGLQVQGHAAGLLVADPAAAAAAAEGGGARPSQAQGAATAGTRPGEAKRLGGKMAVVVKAVLGSHFGVGEFTTQFRLPIVMVGLNRMFTGG